MLQSKDINKIAELKNGFTPRWLEPDFILSSLKCFSFSAVCFSTRYKHYHQIEHFDTPLLSC